MWSVRVRERRPMENSGSGCLQLPLAICNQRHGSQAATVTKTQLVFERCLVALSLVLLLDFLFFVVSTGFGRWEIQIGDGQCCCAVARRLNGLLSDSTVPSARSWSVKSVIPVSGPEPAYSDESWSYFRTTTSGFHPHGMRQRPRRNVSTRRAKSRKKS